MSPQQPRPTGTPPSDTNATGDSGRHAYLYDIFEYSPFTTVIVDSEGRVVDFNAAKRFSGDRLPKAGDVMYRDYAAKHTVDMHAELLDCLKSGKTRSYTDMSYGSKTLTITIAPFPGGGIIVTQDVTEAKRAEHEMVALIDELQRALREIETLRTLLPICASCKRIRDDSGYWNSVEEYFTRRGNVNFSHTVCPECMGKLYPELCDNKTGQPLNRPAAPAPPASF
jgi:hypothetical protein